MGTVLAYKRGQTHCVFVHSNLEVNQSIKAALKKGKNKREQKGVKWRWGGGKRKGCCCNAGPMHTAYCAYMGDENSTHLTGQTDRQTT